MSGLFSGLARAKAQYGVAREGARRQQRAEDMQDDEVQREIQNDIFTQFARQAQQRQQQQEFQARLEDQRLARQEQAAYREAQMQQNAALQREFEQGRNERAQQGLQMQKYTTDQNVGVRREMAQMAQDKPPKPRAVPASAIRSVTTNEGQMRVIDNAINRITQDPQSVGWKAYLPDALLQRGKAPGYASGVEARADIADIGSLIIHDRSGAAVSISEFPRLQPFVPSPKDDSKTVLKKLQRLKEKIIEETSATREAYSPDYGYTGFKDPNEAPAPTQSVTSYGAFGVKPVRGRRP